MQEKRSVNEAVFHINHKLRLFADIDLYRLYFVSLHHPIKMK